MKVYWIWDYIDDEKEGNNFLNASLQKQELQPSIKED
jgi:hypothetical protein